MKLQGACLSALFCLLLFAGFESGARAQTAGDRPVLKPAGSGVVRKPVQQPTDAVRKRSGQVAAPTNSKDKQPKWNTTTTPPETPSASAIPEDQARELFERAKVLLSEQKPQDALPLLRRAEDLAPGRFEIHYLLGVTLSTLGKPDQAIYSFQKAINIKPDFAGSHAGSCLALAETGNWIDAVDGCREAVRLEPNNRHFRTQLAELYLNNDRASEAIGLLELSFRQSENDLVSTGTLADAYFAVGDYSRAASLYERIAATWPAVTITYLRLSGVYDYLDRQTDMIKAARKFAELEPKLALSHLNLGFAFQSTGFFEEAVAPLEQAVLLDDKKGDAYLALAESYETLGDKGNGLKNLRLAYQHLPRDPYMSVRLAQSLWDAGRLREAVEPLEWANNVFPDTPQIMRPLGFAYIEIGKYDEGVELIEGAARITPLPPGFEINISAVKNRHTLIARFDELLENVSKNPSDIRSRYELAVVYKYKGMLREQEQQFLEVVKIAPTHANYANLGILYADRGETEKALGPALKAAELNPHHVYYLTLANHYEKLGRIDDAIQAAKRSIELKPAGLENRIMLGDLWLKKGNRQEALKEYQEGFAIAAGDPRPNFKLAWLYVRMGNRDGAFRHYSILKGISPGDLTKLELSLRAHFGDLR